MFEQRFGALPWRVEHDHLVATLGRLVRIADCHTRLQTPALQIALACFNGPRILFDGDQGLGLRRQSDGEVADPAVKLEYPQSSWLGELDNRLDEARVDGVVGLRKRTRRTFEGVALYAEWTTEDEDWAAYERVWRNQVD